MDKAHLIRALEEYKIIKEESKNLKELETIGYYFKEPDKDVGEVKTVFNLEGLTLDGLITAFSALMLKRERKIAEEEIREIPRDSFTVEQKIAFILETLETQEETTFEELFTADFTKAEIITTFQAMLELLKYQFLRVRQEATFGEITITLNPDREEEAQLGEIDEYD